MSAGRKNAYRWETCSITTMKEESRTSQHYARKTGNDGTELGMREGKKGKRKKLPQASLLQRQHQASCKIYPVKGKADQ